ncbi:MAG TPA: hypothetical protein VNJ08_11655 [Bacteriovoracaceae bacterium]|nr:hypothetical protein [Bacteriovoracaceae bacterium]
MKLCLLLALNFALSCTQGPKLKQHSELELTDYVMKESLLANAVNSASVAAPNCIQPFEANIPKPVYNRLTQMMGQNFNQDDLYKSIRSRIIAGTDKEKLLGLAEQLNGETWKKFLSSIPKSEDNKKFTKIFHALDEGTFDLKSRRSQLVAQITDHAFMLNLVKVSNSQVMKMMPEDINRPKTRKQKSVMEWIARELETFNDAHIKALYANTYLTTEKMTEAELEELLRIRSHDVLRLGKHALEEELQLRYQKFFKQMVEFRDGGSAPI